MSELISKIEQLQNSKLSFRVKAKIEEFKRQRLENSWFSELCFCLLTANWKAKPAIEIQNEIGDGFCNYNPKKLKNYLRKKGHRFWNQRAERICLARNNLDIKEKLKGKSSFEAREWLVKNIKGLGYKEASHFLRNLGYFDLAILDRHILNLLNEYRYIDKIPKTLTKKRYFQIENIFNSIAEKVRLNSAELDLYMWYLKTGEILK